MKLKFSKLVGQFLAKSLLLIGLSLVPLAVMGTDSIYISTGTITTPPNVDATNFLNTGTWNIDTSPGLYITANTLNYTNEGLMEGAPGWEFDFGPSTTGKRSLSGSFFNDTTGTIEAQNGTFSFLTTASTGGSKLLIQATNIVNKGTLSATAYGYINLVGTNVDISRSTLEISSITGTGSGNNFSQTNFVPDTAIYDEYWGQSSVDKFDSAAVWNGTDASVSSPTINVSDPCGDVNPAPSITYPPSFADYTNIVVGVTNVAITNMDASVTNILLPTNIVRQAVFVAVGDPNIGGDVRFASTGNPDNKFDTVTVELGSKFGDTLYLVDTLASQTNRGVLANNSGQVPGSDPVNPCTGPTFRPANYVLSRIGGAGGASGPGQAPPGNFFYDPNTFSNALVHADSAAYAAYVDDLGYDPYGDALTNLMGKITINADNLNLNKATLISGGPEVTIQANNLINSTGAVVQCQNLSFNLGATSGHLNVTNLVSQSSLPGLHGYIFAWSDLWTNQETMVVTNPMNYLIVTNTANGTTNIVATPDPITNTFPVECHVLLVDAAGLISEVPVTVQDLVLHSTNMLVSDSMTVARSLLFDGQSLTLQGTLNLTGTNLENWTYANAPTLQYFTNNGVLNIPNIAHFGDDGPTNYAVFVNHGTISAGSETINSTDYQNTGNDSVAGGFDLTTVSGSIENASINSGQGVDLDAGTLKLNKSTIVAGNVLNLDVTNSLYDSGGASGNQLSCGNGFNLLVKPATGDLLGTAITTVAPGDALVVHTWAALDEGQTAAGFSNNVAVGKLVLSPQDLAAGPLFEFSGTGSSNAIYVDDLDLSQLSTNYAEVMQIDPNLVIYYASAQLGFTPPANANGIPQEPEEYLNGQFNGHLRWVSSFAGPNSSVDVLINGKTVAVNRALRYSKIIDSNGDGIPNYYDTNPFGVPSFAVSGSLVLTNQPPGKTFAISWKAAPNTIYQVEFTTNLLLGNWQSLLNYTNNTGTNQAVTVWDTNTFSGQRFYRESASSQLP
jgi:hypothetical protein